MKRVKALGGVMRDELSEQAVILEQLEEDVDKADSGMQTMNKKHGPNFRPSTLSGHPVWNRLSAIPQ